MEDVRGDWDAPGVDATQGKTARKRVKTARAWHLLSAPSKPMLYRACVNQQERGIFQIC